MPPLIRLENVSFFYDQGARPVLRDVTFSLDQGNRIGVIGPNGSGKTTLFHIIMGLLRPASGKVLFHGRPMEQEKDFRELRSCIGLVFQQPDDQLFNPTVLEDVAFGPLNQGLSPSEARQRAEATLEELGLQGFANRLTHRLSGGDKRLVSLATVLSMRPQALLLDDPTNDLDSDTRERLGGILEHLPVSLMIVSHDWDFLDRTTSCLLALNDGRLVEDCKPIPHQHRHAHLQGHVHHQHLDPDKNS